MFCSPLKKEKPKWINQSLVSDLFKKFFLVTLVFNYTHTMYKFIVETLENTGSQNFKKLSHGDNNYWHLKYVFLQKWFYIIQYILIYYFSPKICICIVNKYISPESFWITAWFFIERYMLFNSSWTYRLGYVLLI